MISKTLNIIQNHYSSRIFKSFSSLVHVKVSNDNSEKADVQIYEPQNETRTATSPLDKCTEDLSYVAPNLRPTFNFAAYINKSETLQELLKLGVNFYKLERKETVPPIILKLDFKGDIKPLVTFLCNLGVPHDEVGQFITKNPFIFQEEMENLESRVNYLLSKKFSNEMIQRIVTKNPFWLNFSIPNIDERLGFFQKQFQLSGNQVRSLAVKQPKLITYKIHSIKVNHFVLKEEMGFENKQIKTILLTKPKIFMKNQNKILNTFEFVHKTMGISHEMILKSPEILTFREFRLKERHMYLETLGKAQYNPKEPNYVSLSSLAGGTDVDFCDNVAKTSVKSFNAFLKTL